MKPFPCVALAMMSALMGCASVDPPSKAAATEDLVFGPGGGIDHVLLWTREVEQDTAVLRDRLGFNVVPGGSFPDQVANRLIYFGNESYLELLHFTVPLSQLEPARLEDMKFLQDRDGSIGFGIRVDDLERMAGKLAASGLETTDVSPGSFDPDGPTGPEAAKEALFRTMGFKERLMAGLDPFFVWYAPWPALTSEGRAQWETTTSHRNTAQRPSAVWILPTDTAIARSVLEKVGYTPGRNVDMPQIGARGTVFDAGRTSIVLIEPEKEGLAADALRLRGPHVVGISLEVTDLAAASDVISDGYGLSPQRYEGPFGESVMAPSQEDLGLLIEFHAAR